MRKIILLLVSSFLLIALTAGSSLAALSSTLVDATSTETNIVPLSSTTDVAPGQPIEASNYLEGVASSDLPAIYGYVEGSPTGQHLINAQIDVVSGDGTDQDFKVYWISHQTFPINGKSDLFNVVVDGVKYQGDYLDKDNIRIVFDPVDKQKAVGTIYNVYVETDKFTSNAVKFRASTSQQFNGIPEFPTVALPVAAILGIIFVFGRKKGDL